MAKDLLLGKTKRDWSMGSLLLPKKQQDAIFAKLDDVRYDIRGAARKAQIGLLSLSAATALLALSHFRKRG